MDILYPRLRANQIGRMLGAAIVGALIGTEFPDATDTRVTTVYDRE